MKYACVVVVITGPEKMDGLQRKVKRFVSFSGGNLRCAFHVRDTGVFTANRFIFEVTQSTPQKKSKV